MPHMSKKIVSVVMIATAGAALAACSAEEDPQPGADDSGAAYDCTNPNADTMTDVTIVGMPILSNAAMYVGEAQGFFADNGLKPTFEMVPSPPAGISALAGGSADFAFTTSVNLLQAAEQGQPVKGVAAFAGIAPDYYDKMKAGEDGYETGINALLVDDESGIRSAADLEGKTVAVQDPVFSQMMVQYVVKQDGGDPSAVKFVPMAPADSYQALLAGQIDAAQSSFPFINGWEEKGLENLGWLEVEVFHEGPTSFIVANDDFIAEHPETVARLNCAIRLSAEYANENPDALRDETATRQDIDRAVLEEAVVPYFFTETDVEGVERFAEIMAEFGHLSEVPDVETVFAEVALAGKGDS